MEATSIVDLYVNYGVTAVIIIAFFILVFWVLKTSKEREEKLYKIIDALSEQLPEIREMLVQLPQIREAISRVETKIDKSN